MSSDIQTPITINNQTQGVKYRTREGLKLVLRLCLSKTSPKNHSFYLVLPVKCF